MQVSYSKGADCVGDEGWEKRSGMVWHGMVWCGLVGSAGGDHPLTPCPLVPL